MNIVVWGINYHPEPTGIGLFNTDLAEYFASRGHDVTMVSTFPYYPFWRREARDERQLFRREARKGVRLIRCWCHVPKGAGVAGRILHEFSFALLSFAAVLARRKTDVCLVISPPLLLGFLAGTVLRLLGRPYVLHVQDLQPDAAVELGMLRQRTLIGLLRFAERVAYCGARTITTITEGMAERVCSKGFLPEKVQVLPNWVRTEDTLPGLGREEARRRLGLEYEGFLAFYSGNLGRKQGLEQLLEAARLLVGSPVRLVLAGAGAGRADLEVAIRGLACDRIELKPLLSETDYALWLKAADLALITQAPGTGKLFFPSKVLSCLVAGLPILAVCDTDSELALALSEGGFGDVVPTGQPGKLAERLKGLAASPEVLVRYRLGTRWVQRFERKAVLGAFEAVLEAARGSGPQRRTQEAYWRQKLGHS